MSFSAFFSEVAPGKWGIEPYLAACLQTTRQKRIRFDFKIAICSYLDSLGVIVNDRPGTSEASLAQILIERYHKKGSSDKARSHQWKKRNVKSPTNRAQLKIQQKKLLEDQVAHEVQNQMMLVWAQMESHQRMAYRADQQMMYRNQQIPQTSQNQPPTTINQYYNYYGTMAVAPHPLTRPTGVVPPSGGCPSQAGTPTEEQNVGGGGGGGEERSGGLEEGIGMEGGRETETERTDGFDDSGIEVASRGEQNYVAFGNAGEEQQNYDNDYYGDERDGGGSRERYWSNADDMDTD